jgi:hypothetical protein
MPAPAWRNQVSPFMGVRRIRISLYLFPAGYGERSGQSTGTVIK